MNIVRFDFLSNKVSEVDLEQKISDLIEKFELDSNDFFKIIIPHVVGYYVSSSNIDRKPSEKLLQNGRNAITLDNFFFRFKFDNYLKKLLQNKTIVLKGDLFFTDDEIFNNVKIKDIYLQDDEPKQTYEYEIDCETDYQCKAKSAFTYGQAQKNILLFPALPLAIPKIINVEKFNSFINKWDTYLEFGKAITLQSIEYYLLNKWDLMQAFEVVNNESNQERFDGFIYGKNDSYLYINKDCPMLKGGETPFNIMEVTIESKLFGESPDVTNRKIKSLKSKNELGVYSKKDIELLDKIKKGEAGEAELNGIMVDSLLDFNVDKDMSLVKLFLVLSNDKINSNKKDINNDISKLGNELFIANYSIGDIILYKRGKEALLKLRRGDVKNPHLAGILIEPRMFERNSELYTEDNVKFAMKKLNDSQKQSVIKCLNSNSIFLLQGPPGTGKTQTITELVYQYNKMGKKVLLSSQTHIAIDNVIERLPKELNILPIRLVGEKGKANAQYLPDKLLDNLYNAAYEKYREKIESYNNYEKDIEILINEFIKHQTIFIKYSERLKEAKELELKYNKEREILAKLHSWKNMLITQLDQNNKISLFDLYRKNGLAFESITDDIMYEPLFEACLKLAKQFKIEWQDDFYNLAIKFKRIAGKTRIYYLKERLNSGSIPQEIIEIEKEIEELNIAIKSLKGLSIAVPEGLIKKMNDCLQRKKNIDKKHSEVKVVNIDRETFYFINKEKFTNGADAIIAEIAKAKELVEEYNKVLKNVFSDANHLALCNDIDNNTSKLEQCENDIKKEAVLLQKIKDDKDEIENPIKKEEEKLAAYFNRFFIEKLNDNSLPIKEEEKFEKIEKHIEEEKKKFGVARENFNKYKSIYKSLSKYLANRDDFVPEQREKYTAKLLKNNANVVGITCTSGHVFNFKAKDDDDAKGLSLQPVYISKMDFDVVIIDEVSKATPIEMLIPIVNGKSVVLVGDQRQLPPIFKYRDSIFKYMTEEERSNILQQKELSYFKDLVENSLFDEIYGQLKTNKAMLKKQYRFNDAIMGCVNVFYDGLLELGSGEEQNNKKQHYLNVNIPDRNNAKNSIPIFNKSQSTYWFDSHKFSDGSIAYSENREGKTSYYNKLEGKITVELLLLLDEGYGELKTKDPETYKKAAGEGDKPSVAIISMYSDQINFIKKELNRRHKNVAMFNNISLDISTVDNYQGKEKDIILLNMVVNNKSGDAGEFTKKYNRINVAISRARNMLIVVGSRNFCNGLSINVPHINDGEDNYINAYYQIYEKCQSRWESFSGLLGIAKE